MVNDSIPARVILGSGRSGTTWVLDCVAQANELRPLFEPLNPGESALGARYAYRVMTRDDVDDVLQLWFRNLAAGSVRSRWIDYRAPERLLFPNVLKLATVGFARHWIRAWQGYFCNRRVFRVAAQRDHVLIKFIRANLMAGWLAQTMGFRTVLIVRHPCAVVESKLRSGSSWDPFPVLARYREDSKLHEVTSGRYLSLIHGKLSPVQALTLNWVIENQWPVERSEHDDYAVVYYEDLISKPEISWPALCDWLKLSNTPGADLLRKPSQQTYSRQTDSQQRSEPGWKSRLTQQQLSEVQNVLDAAKCGLYNIDESGPAATT